MKSFLIQTTLFYQWFSGLSLFDSYSTSRPIVARRGNDWQLNYGLWSTQALPMFRLSIYLIQWRVLNKILQCYCNALPLLFFVLLNIQRKGRRNKWIATVHMAIKALKFWFNRSTIRCTSEKVRPVTWAAPEFDRIDVICNTCTC